MKKTLFAAFCIGLGLMLLLSASAQQHHRDTQGRSNHSPARGQKQTKATRRVQKQEKLRDKLAEEIIVIQVKLADEPMDANKRRKLRELVESLKQAQQGKTYSPPPISGTRTLLFTPDDQARVKVVHPLLTPEVMQQAQVLPIEPSAAEAVTLTAK